MIGTHDSEAHYSEPRPAGAHHSGAHHSGTHRSSACGGMAPGARGFGRAHYGNLRRSDCGAAAKSRASARSGLSGFGHWREALDVVDRCLGVLGAPASVIRLLTRLCSHVPSAAWEGNGPLLVWPSNAHLSVELAMDVRSVQRLIAIAEQHALLARHLGEGHRRTNRRLADGSLAGDGGIDLAPMLATARALERGLDIPRQAALSALRHGICDVQRLGAEVIEAAEALEQALIDGLTCDGLSADGPGGDALGSDALGVAVQVDGDRELLSIDAAIEDARRCRQLASGLARRLGTQDLEALDAAKVEVDRMRDQMRARRAALAATVERALSRPDAAPAIAGGDRASPGPGVAAGAAPEGRASGEDLEPKSRRGDEYQGKESPQGDSGVVQNNKNPTSSRLGSAASSPVPAGMPRPDPMLPGLADAQWRVKAGLRDQMASIAPSYAARFSIAHLLEACPLLAEAAAMWGVAPDRWGDLADEPEVLQVLCRHAATAAGFSGERWGVEARRWGMARAMLATAAALGKPPHLVTRNRAALLSWYFSDGLARPALDLLATLHANRRYWRTATAADTAHPSR